MNKPALLIIACIVLAGCEKRDPSKNLISTSQTPLPPTNPNVPQNIMVAGQSNAAGLSPNGIAILKTIIGNNTNIIDCAVPGTSISEWAPGSANLNNCLAKMPYPDALIWYQGETDANYPNYANTWAQRFTDIVITIRNHSNKPIPVVYAQLARDQTNDYPGFPLPDWQTVKAQQASLHLANATMITTDDIDPDGIHFTQSGYQQLGQRFAIALKQLEAAK